MFMFDKYSDPGSCPLPEMTKYFGLGGFIDRYEVKSGKQKSEK